jgi:DNA-directed RNA polymerase subunit RPC12/RpoP
MKNQVPTFVGVNHSCNWHDPLEDTGKSQKSHRRHKMIRQVWVCSKCGRTVKDDPNSTRGWLIAKHRDAEKQFHGEMVIRCPAHITAYALSIAKGGKKSIR